MEFKSYGEIENAYSSKLLDYAKTLDKNIVYACYRKIDGSNFQISIDENDAFVIGSRNRIIPLTDNFENWQHVVEKDDIENKLRKIKAKLKESNDFAKSHDKFSMTIFGELCGGMYRHKDVEKVKNATRIQGRIDYSPDNEWIPFDLRLSDGFNFTYLNLDEFSDLCKEFGLKCEIEEFRGTLDQCLAFSPIFNDDTGNRLFGYPIIENNTAEGVVIKPINELFLRSQRIIFKNKNSNYKERIRATKKNCLDNPGLKDIEIKWLNILKEYMNENRVYSAGSKIGFDNFGDLLKESSCDALKDFLKDYKSDIDEIERTYDPKDFNFKNITKIFNKFSSAIVREVFLKNR